MTRHKLSSELGRRLGLKVGFRALRLKPKFLNRGLRWYRSPMFTRHMPLFKPNFIWDNNDIYFKSQSWNKNSETHKTVNKWTTFKPYFMCTMLLYRIKLYHVVSLTSQNCCVVILGIKHWSLSYWSPSYWSPSYWSPSYIDPQIISHNGHTLHGSLLMRDKALILKFISDKALFQSCMGLIIMIRPYSTVV